MSDNTNKKGKVKIIKNTSAKPDKKKSTIEKMFLKRADKEEEGDIDELEQDKDFEISSEEDEEETTNTKDKSHKEEEEVEDEENLDDDKTKKDEEGYDEEKPTKDDDEGCLYNFNKVNLDEEEEEDLGLTDEEVSEKNKVVERITKPFLTKYERVRALGARAKQLSMGAKPMLKNVEQLSAKDIAKLELENKVMPFIIERPMPNGQIEVWDINELKLSN